MTGGTEARRHALASSTAFVKAANKAFNEGTDGRKKKASQQTTDIQGRIENFWLTELPNSAFSQMLLQMRDLPLDGADVPFAAMEETDIVAYTHYLEEKGVLEGMSEDATGRVVIGRGVQYPTMARVSTVINNIHRLGNKPQPFKDSDKLKEYLIDLHDRHISEGTIGGDYYLMYSTKTKNDLYVILKPKTFLTFCVYVYQQVHCRLTTPQIL